MVEKFWKKMQPIATGDKFDYTRGGIVPKSTRDPLESPVSRSTLLRQELSLPVLESYLFPSYVEDWRVASRAKIILGIEHPIPHWEETTYPPILGKKVFEWLTEIENAIEKGFGHIQVKYITGSAAAYIAGHPVLRQALESFRGQISEKLFWSLSRKISKKKFLFADVDLRIKVNVPGTLGSIKTVIDRIPGCRTEMYNNGQLLLVYVGEHESYTLDITIYTELEHERALNTDDCKVLITDFADNRVQFVSQNPWNWWQGMVLGIMETETHDPRRIMPRLIGQQVRSHISLLPAESILFDPWFAAISQQTRLQEQLYKHETNHDASVPIAGYLTRLRVQQILLERTSTASLLRQAAFKKPSEKVPLLLRAIFKAMNEKGANISAIHGMIEGLALIALDEGLESPFECKLVLHEGIWHMRLRFRGSFGKRDLLVRFNPAETLASLAHLTDGMRPILHALWIDGIRKRDLSSNYSLSSFVKPIEITRIKEKLLRHTSIPKTFSFADENSLATLEVTYEERPDQLLEIGKLLLNYYSHDISLQHNLCWKIVAKCLSQKAYGYATELITLLKANHMHPTMGYSVFFAELIEKGGDIDLYAASSPFPPIADKQWQALGAAADKKKKLFQILNQENVPVELFLEMSVLLKVDPEVSEGMLCHILELENDPKWIQNKDKESFVSERYLSLITPKICENIHYFKDEWLLKFFLSDRYNGFDKERICEIMAGKPLDVTCKASLLQKLNIQNPALWNRLAGEFITQVGDLPPQFAEESRIDSKRIVAWLQVIKSANNSAEVLKLLKTIPALPPKTKDTLRTLVLVRLLKNWETNNIEIDVLKQLDVSGELPWERVLKGAHKALDILKNLDELKSPLFFQLFKAVKPKEDYYTDCLIDKLMKKNLLSNIQNPLIVECLQVNPKACLPLYKELSQSIEGITFILNNFTEADEELLYKMIETTDRLEAFTLGGEVFRKFHSVIQRKPNETYKIRIGNIAKFLILNGGNTQICAEIWKIAPKKSIPASLPNNEQLTRLIQIGAGDWVITMLGSATKQELSQLTPALYQRLFRKIDKLEQRCFLLEKCESVSPFIQDQWEKAFTNTDLDKFQGIKLLRSAVRLKIAHKRIKECTEFIFSKRYGEVVPEIEPSLLNEVLNFLPEMELREAYDLWFTLLSSKRLETHNLWNAGIVLIKRDPSTPKNSFIEWIIKHTPSEKSATLISLIEKIIEFDQSSLPIFNYLKKEALKGNVRANELLWNFNWIDFLSINDFLTLNPSAEKCADVLKKVLSYESHNQDTIDALWKTLNALDWRYKNPSLIQKVFTVLVGHFQFLTHDDLIKLLNLIIEENALLSGLSNLVVFAPDKKESIEKIANVHFQIPRIHELLNYLILHGDPDHFRTVRAYFNYLDDLTPILTIGFATFPYDAQIIFKIKDESRRNYIKAKHLLNPDNTYPATLENAHDLLKYLNILWDYFEKHYETEKINYINSRNENSKDNLINMIVLYYSSILSNKLVLNPNVLLQAISMIRDHPQYPPLQFNLIQKLINIAIGSDNKGEIKYLLVEFTIKLLINSKLNFVFNPRDLCTLMIECKKSYETFSSEILKWMSNPYLQMLDQKLQEDFAISRLLLTDELPKTYSFNLVSKAVEILCKTNITENHERALNFILKLGPLNYNALNRIYIDTVLEKIPNDQLKARIPSLFKHLEHSKYNHCSEIEYNIRMILKVRPEALFHLVEFFDHHISRFIQDQLTEEVIEEYQSWITLILEACEASKDFLIYQRMGIYLCNHPQISKLPSFIKESCPDAAIVCDYFQLLRRHAGDCKMLLKLKVQTQKFEKFPNSIEREIYLRNTWCGVTNQVFKTSFCDEVYDDWLRTMKEEIIRCLEQEALLEDLGAMHRTVIINFDWLFQNLKKYAFINNISANNWLRWFLSNALERVHDPLLLHPIVDIICENVTDDFIPSLSWIENFIKNTGKPSIELYHTFIFYGNRDEEILSKAIEHLNEFTETCKNEEEAYFKFRSIFIHVFQYIPTWIQNKKLFLYHLTVLKHKTLALTSFLARLDNLDKSIAVNYFYKNIELLVDPDICNAVIDFVETLMNTNPIYQSNVLYQNYLLLTVFSGNNNKLSFNIAQATCETLRVTTGKVSPIMYPFLPGITKVPASFKKDMKELSAILDRFTELCPERKDWYDYWKGIISKNS